MRAYILGVVLGLASTSPSLAFERGEWVLGQWKGGEYWYPGVVQNGSGDKVTIRYDDGDLDTRPANQVKPYTWSVGTRVECNFKGQGKWYPGRIAALNNEAVQINYDDGDKEGTKTGRCRSR